MDINEWQWPQFTEEEADAIQQVLLSNKVNYWTGDNGRKFEQEFAKWCGTTHAVALANGTVALELSLQALGIGPGDGVIVTPRTFIASVASIVRVGAYPIFADVNRDSQNITIDTVEAVFSSSCRAVMCVHLAGWPCEMPAILEFARQKKLMVIEDCAQAHGASVNGRQVGSFGDVSAWSFCQDKIMTTGGEGGMVTTNREDIWSRVWSNKDHGKNWSAANAVAGHTRFRWLHDAFGTNARMLEIQAAIGRIQLRRMNDWHLRRCSNARRIWSFCRTIRGLRVPDVPDHIEHAAYKCYVFVEPAALRSSWSRDRIADEINSSGIPCFSGSCSEVYLESAFEGTKLRPRHRLPVARELGETSLMFLIHPTLSDSSVERACDVIKEVMSRATA